MSNGSAPELNQGNNYLLFLYSIPDGSSYNTEGDHYYILGGSSGAWKQAGEGDAYVNPSELEDNRNVTTDDVTTAVKQLSPNGDEDSNSGAQATIEQIEQDYQNGSLSEEAYRDYPEIAQKEASSFATVLTGDEALAAEKRCWEQAASRYRQLRRSARKRYIKSFKWSEHSHDFWSSTMKRRGPRRLRQRWHGSCGKRPQPVLPVPARLLISVGRLARRN